MGDGDPDTALTEIERAMVRIRRSQTRRTLARLAGDEDGAASDPGLTSVVDAVEEGPERSDREVTVGDVAQRLGVDPSRASRLVTRAIESGHVARVASQADGRRVGLELTPAGREHAEAVHRSRQTTFDRLMRYWPARDREDLARLLTRFTDALADDARRPRRT